MRHLWGTMRVRHALAGRGQPLLPENSHAIPLGQFSTCPENVGIATVRFQSLNNREGNCMRHLWGTMRVCGDLAGGPHAGRRGPRRTQGPTPDAGVHAGRRLRVGGKTGPVSIKQAPRP